MESTNPTLCVIGAFSSRYGMLFSKKRYGVMGTLKKALWRYEGPLAPSPHIIELTLSEPNS